MVHFSSECSARELIVTEPHTQASACGCPVARVCVAVRCGLCEAEERMSSLSYDTKHAVVSVPCQLILAVCGMEQVLERPLRGTIWLLLSPADVVKLRTSVKEWNKGSKLEPYGELFFFLMEQNPYENSGELTSTSFDMCDFTPILKQNSILSRFRDYRLVPRSDPVGPVF